MNIKDVANQLNKYSAERRKNQYYTYDKNTHNDELHAIIEELETDIGDIL
jgi:hypothetical protein